MAWAYCHVPNGSTFDMTQRIEDQIERFAPGFKERVLARHAMSPAAVERHDANYIGGDIAVGSTDLRQLVTRPVCPGARGARPCPVCISARPPPRQVRGARDVWMARRPNRRFVTGPENGATGRALVRWALDSGSFGI